MPTVVCVIGAGAAGFGAATKRATRGYTIDTDKPHPQDFSHKPHIQGHLGDDLPATENQLFELDEFPLLDINSAMESIGSKQILHEILVMVNQDILKDGNAIEKAYAEKKWETVAKLAHKMKGGALYSGTVRMKYACQYLERYQKAGHTARLGMLCLQLLHVLNETKQCIDHWLEQ